MNPCRLAVRDTLGGAMNYTEIDYHKRFSVACTLDRQGRLLKQTRVDHNVQKAFAA